MKKEDFSLVLGDIRDDFIAQAHQPARACRSAAPVWRRWCAAACLCLVTATAVLLTARYLPLKDYKAGDTNYFPSQPLTNYQIGVEACYKAPDPGEYFCFVEVNAARKQYAGRNVKFLLEMDVFQNGEQVAAGSLGGEFKRLAALGYDLRLVNLQEQDDDLIITWPIAVGLFTEEQIRNFPVNSEYGYAFCFPTNPDGTPVQIEEPNLITAADVSSLPPTGTLSTP